MIDDGTLFRAILAMDAYNRGYNAGLKISSSQKIGLADLKIAMGDEPAQSAGFFAQSYQLGGETIIAYRGTDVLPALNLALFNPSTWTDIAAWSIWFEQNYNATQVRLAVDFYRLVQQTLGGNIVTTGHSLGGALAGL